MKNFIVINTDVNASTELRWGNNDQDLTNGTWQREMQISIDHCECHNRLWISNDTDIECEILDMNMYGFGQGKIKYWGRFFPALGGPGWNSHIIHAMGTWQLDWQYPTFTWLHQSLGMGWLVKPVKT